MSHSRFFPLRLSRKAALASAAVVALAAAGAIGELSVASATAANEAPAADQNGQAAPSFAGLIARVKPAVVSVKVKIVDASPGLRWDRSSGNLDNLPPEIRRFFQQFGEGTPGQGGTKEIIQSEGSGFFVSPDGYIVTNNHVVQNAKTVTVVTDDGKTLDAKVVGTDPKTDLAVVKVDQKGDYPYVSFASQTPRIGDWVVAIGNPYGLGGTATAGIISAKGRDIGDGPYDRFLQIDAPINKGNSGGPTFNMEGQVIGVNTAIYSPSGGSVGIGFDIPAATVQTAVAALEQHGYVARGYLGVEVQPVTRAIADSLGLKAASGALVARTMPDTPAAAAGLKPGDVITQLNGQTIDNAVDLTRRIGMMKPGEKATLAYMRDNAEKTADVSLASQSNEKVASAAEQKAETAPTKLGLDLAPASQVAGAGDKGVAIVAVDPNGEAADRGVAVGDLILDVQGHPVSTPAEVKSDMAAAQKDGRKAVLMRIQTAQGDRFVAFPFS